jgi:putative Mg2+ transporter-C (MgtC) family protein
VELIIQDLAASFPNLRELARIVMRLLAALVVGAIVGYQRERMGKAAGLRTHMLVALGTALFVISGVEFGMREDALSRVIQGIVTGLGFLGAGAIIKITAQREIHGLTTAAGIWMTAGAGVAIGLGQIGLALVAAVFAWIVLAIFQRFAPEPTEGPEHGNG